VFSVKDPVAFQDFSSVFRSDLDDPALRNAVMLSFALAVTGGNMDQECVGYQNQVLATVRQRLGSPETALSLPTLGAILLLAGVEVSRQKPSKKRFSVADPQMPFQARLGMRWQVQLHMGAIRRLLDMSQSGTIYMTDGIKRAIFW